MVRFKHNKKRNTAYWYSPNFDYNNSNIENEYCYIKNKFKSYAALLFPLPPDPDWILL